MVQKGFCGNVSGVRRRRPKSFGSRFRRYGTSEKGEAGNITKGERSGGRHIDFEIRKGR